MKKIFLITRGITLEEENNYFSKLNSELSRKGLMQIENLANILNVVDYENIICSDSRASMNSGEIIRNKNIFGFSKNIMVDIDLRERCTENNKILNERLIYSKYIRSNFENFNVGESGIAIWNRLQKFVNKLYYFKGKNIIVTNPENVTIICRILERRDDIIVKDFGKMIIYELEWFIL